MSLDRLSPLTDAEFQCVLDAMISESHRGCVLVGVALLEWKMAEVLKSTLLLRHEEEERSRIEKEIETMLNPLNEKSILGAAAARGRMCRVLGLISHETHKLLKDVLAFRNKYFAHFRGKSKLTDEHVKSALEALNAQLPLGKVPTLKIYQRGLRLDKEHSVFMRIVIYLFVRLDEGVPRKRPTSHPSSP
jgi:hypothetical protein